MPAAIPDSVFKTIDGRRDELVELTRQLIGFPMANPPGEACRPCAEFIGRRSGEARIQHRQRACRGHARGQ
jgi:succinyl-diaminopimelate desuccinylase